MRLHSSTKFSLSVKGRLISCLIFICCSCSETLEKKELEPKELIPKETKEIKSSENELFQEAQKHYANGLYTVARENFENLKNNFPDGPYREYAELKIGDTYFESNDFAEAAKVFSEFSANHPSSTSLAYAQLKIARSYQLMHRGVGKDITPVEKAIENYKLLIQKHPNSPYTAAAKEYLNECEKLFAEQDRFISEYYSSREKESAALEREKSYASKLRTINSKGKKKRIEQASLVELSKEQNDTEHDGAGLEAPSLVGAEAVINKNSAYQDFNRMNTSDIQPEHNNDEDIAKIQRIVCSKLEQPAIFIYLSKSISDDFIADNADIKSNNNLLTLKIPALPDKSSIESCFGTRDLVISADGTLTLSGNWKAAVLSLSAPPRLLVNLNKNRRKE